MHRLFLLLISGCIASSVLAGSVEPSVSHAMAVASTNWNKQNFNQAFIVAMRDSTPYKQSAMAFALSNPVAYRYVFDEISYAQREAFFNALLASQQTIVANQRLILNTLLSDQQKKRFHKKSEVDL